jgi:hypothetical protein
MADENKALALLERIAAAVEHLAMRQHFVPAAPAESTDPSDSPTALATTGDEPPAPANTETATEVKYGILASE